MKYSCKKIKPHKETINNQPIRKSPLGGFRGLLLLLILFSCQSTPKESEKQIAVTILPLQYFAERIVGDKYSVICMVPSGSSPESYEPAPSQLIELSKSEAYFKLGYIGFELAWMNKLKETNPSMQVFDTSSGIALIHGDHDCSHHHAHEHTHEGDIDPHTWCSPKSAKVIAENIGKVFIHLDTQHETFYSDNLNALLADIHQTDSLLQAVLKKSTNKSFLIYHPTLTYLARDYGLTQIAIEQEGKEPSPAQLKALIDKAKAENIQIIFVQKEFDERNAQLISKETGCKLIQINPLSYDWINEMKCIVAAIAATEN